MLSSNFGILVYDWEQVTEFYSFYDICVKCFKLIYFVYLYLKVFIVDSILDQLNCNVLF